MSFWKKLKAFFTGESPEDNGLPRPRFSREEQYGDPGGDQDWQPPTTRYEDNPYEAGSLLSLTPEEARAKALTIKPWQSEWGYRTDIIPPADDERTALVDRGLVIGGYLGKDELASIHALGDRWLVNHERDRLLRARSAKSVDEAIAKLREEERERKREKQELAAKLELDRVEAVARRKATDIIYVGRGVSKLLGDRRCDVEALEAAELPILATPADVAGALDVTVPHLRWLCYHAEALERTHYTQFEVPKRSGGVRLLSAPKSHLRRCQEWVLANIVSRLEVHDAAHGFVPGRSIVTNATLHRGQAILLTVDLKDFFPTITVHRVRGVFQQLGYSPAAATLLALLCTESPRREMVYDGRTYFVAVGERALPQGACTSPALSNLVARRLDRRLAGLARKQGWVYSRYADDLTLSAANKASFNVGKVLAQLRHIIGEEGFALNPAKVHIQRAGGRQTVTGLVVNDSNKLGLPRAEVRKLRAIIHNIEKTGLEAQNRAGHPNFEDHLRGKLAFLAMVDPEKARVLRGKLDRALKAR